MSAMPNPVLVPATLPAVRRRVFTCDEYLNLSESGFFGSERVELIGGDIFTRPPMGTLHGLGIDLLRVALEQAFGPGCWVRAQQTLDLRPNGVPDPDISVVPGPMRSFIGQRTIPTTALLVAEVSDSTLADDRQRKGSLYAAAGLQEYWILNIPGRVLEVYRDPRPDATAEFGHGYTSLSTLQAGDTVSPLAAPAAVIRVDDVLPR